MTPESGLFLLDRMSDRPNLHFSLGHLTALGRRGKDLKQEN